MPDEHATSSHAASRERWSRVVPRETDGLTEARAARDHQPSGEAITRRERVRYAPQPRLGCIKSAAAHDPEGARAEGFGVVRAAASERGARR